MVVPIIAGLGIAARIAATIAKSPTARAGIKKAIEKFGKDAVKQHAGKIPSVVRGSKITKSTKQAKKQQAKTAANTKAGAKDTSVSVAPKVKKSKNPRIPDRRTTLGKAGYNYQWLNKGGSVNSRSIAKKYFKGGLV